jgi:hypothetical protein
MAVLTRYKTKGLWWFRIFGYGLCCKDITIYPLLFSERTGRRKFLRIGRWIIKWLKNDGIMPYSTAEFLHFIKWFRN